ncbi:MAG: NADH:flavin oxidoreductase [Pseudomonadota bacterium]
MSNDPLLQPYQLKHLTLKNRIMSTAHEPSYSEDGMPKDTYRLYHAEKAKGGIAMTMTAGSALVAEDSPAAFGNLHAYKDEIVPWLKRLTDDCHEHDCKVMIQLTHLGRRTMWNHSDWLPVVSASPVREPAHRAFPKEAEDWDIARIVTRYAEAAERMQAAGLDGIELECYGHLIDGFWSPLTNQRDDDYGGSLDNRLRFVREILSSIRAKVGPAFIVGLRMVADEDQPGGLTKQDGIEIARRMVATGHVDFLNIIRGMVDSENHLADVIPLQGMTASPHLDFAGEIRAATKFPVFHAARINDVATARHAIAEGKLDMVGMTRAHIADPHIVRKVTEGREASIRPCVGATYCLGRIYEGHGALCIHNAATGREKFMPQTIPPAETAKRIVVVVGAGPAGLEAARVAAERGHRVTLMEAQDQPGGQIRLIARTKRRAEMIGIVDWRIAELERLGVEMHFNTYADMGDVTAEDPDVVIIATGGIPHTDVCTGSDLVTSSWEILSGDAKPGAEVLVFDDHGQEHGLQATEMLADAGSRVEFVTPERSLGSDVSGLNAVPYQRSFAARDVRVTINTGLQAVARCGNRLVATLGTEYADRTWEREVDQIVVEHATTPADELYFDLKPLSRNLGEVDQRALIAGTPQTIATNPDGTFQLFRIGDAVAARNIHAAIYDALRLVKDL